MRKTLVTMTAATVAAAGLVFVAPAGATTAPQGDDSPSTASAGDSGEPDAANGSARHRPHRIARRIAARTAAESLGVPIEELRTAVLGGQTVTEYAEAQGADPAAVQADVVAALNEAIDRAVANGRVPEERAAKAKEHVDDFAGRFMTSLPQKVEAPTT